jgi:hypothetical protein
MESTSSIPPMFLLTRSESGSQKRTRATNLVTEQKLDNVDAGRNQEIRFGVSGPPLRTSPWSQSDLISSAHFEGYRVLD